MSPKRAVLLDIDGTLLLSNEAHARAWSDALAEHGFVVPVSRLLPMIGMGGDKLLAEAVPGLRDDAAPGKEIAKRRREIFLAHYLPAVKPAPGGRALLLRLAADGFTLVAATSAQSGELDALLRAATIADLIEGATTADQVGRSKPDPDIVRGALQCAQTDAALAVMLGDTAYDIEAAQRANVATIAVRCGGWADRDLQGAVAIYDDPAAILRDYAASPFAR